MKKHEAFGARNALEHLGNHPGHVELERHSLNSYGSQSLGLYSGEAPTNFIFLAEKKLCCLLLFYPK